MTYLIRALKYFITVSVVCTLVILFLVACNFVEADIDSIFVNGKDSIWMILAVFAAVSAIYPSVGYHTSKVHTGGTLDELSQTIEDCMESRGYILEKKDSESMSFRKKNITQRITKVFEDRIVIGHEFGGITVSGLRRDCVVIAGALAGALNDARENIDEQ